MGRFIWQAFYDWFHLRNVVGVGNVAVERWIRSISDRVDLQPLEVECGGPHAITRSVLGISLL